MLSQFAYAFAIITSLVFTAAPLKAQNADELQNIITRQIEAFQADDGKTAFGFASAKLQTFFQSPERFMSMVKRGYEPVYRPQTYSFGETSVDTSGPPIQRVKIIDQRGKSWVAVYKFEKHSDGSWRISGVTLEPISGDNV